MRNRIISEIKLARFFSLLVDGTDDINGNDQMAFVLKYVDSQGKIHERMIGIIALEMYKTGEAMFNQLKRMFEDYKLDFKNINLNLIIAAQVCKANLKVLRQEY